MVQHSQFTTIVPILSGESQSRELMIIYSFSETPFGEALIASTSKGLCYMAFAGNREQALTELKHLFPNAQYANRTNEYQQQALAVFTGDWGSLQPMILHLKGTEFQLNVWKTLLQIPAGTLTTYGNIARQLNNPKASRPVGSAVGSNPVAFIIPCHRVIRSDGGLGGFHWGLECKTKMINWEKEQFK
ncbi:Bifunctional transcriptional activator/DNA repair enzyme Ada [termite gut metagenome]|uniref:methylated-DNA--[protein]-cysteine S-methyltransferase n=1 Tax=termite gut metagenome TaxID=433724 RepID=A0A5J4RA43_9ZZZZ